MFDTHDPGDERPSEASVPPRRRLVLYHLRERGGAASVAALSRAVAAHETDAAPADVESEVLVRVYVSLLGRHLPALAERGLIAYDEDSGVVSLDAADGPAGDARERRRRYASYYAGVAAALGTLAALDLFGPVPVPTPVVAALTLLAVATLPALAALGRSRRGTRGAGLSFEGRS